MRNLELSRDASDDDCLKQRVHRAYFSALQSLLGAFPCGAVVMSAPDESLQLQVQRLAQAVQYAYDPSAVLASNAEARQSIQLQATQYCESVRSSQHGWQLALELFVTHQASPHAKFFALSSLQESLGGRQQAESGRPLLEPSCRQEVRRRLFQSLAERSPFFDSEESYVRTKFAVVLALLLKADFPERWPSAFAEVFQWY